MVFQEILKKFQILWFINFGEQKQINKRNQECKKIYVLIIEESCDFEVVSLIELIRTVFLIYPFCIYIELYVELLIIQKICTLFISFINPVQND